MPKGIEMSFGDFSRAQHAVKKKSAVISVAATTADSAAARGRVSNGMGNNVRDDARNNRSTNLAIMS